MSEIKTTKQQLLNMLTAVKGDTDLPDNVKHKITEIALEYNNLINSETGMARDAHKGLLLSLVEELIIMSDARHLNAPEVQARLKLMRPTLEFVKSVLTHKLKNEHEYRHKLEKGVQELEQKMDVMQRRELKTQKQEMRGLDQKGTETKEATPRLRKK